MRIALLTACCLFVLADGAWAQFSSSGGTQSSFGSRSLGSSLSAGSRTLGRGTGTGGGQGVAGATQQGDTAGQLTGSERYLRQNRQGQFVGSDSGDVANFFSALGSQGGLRGNSGLRAQGGNRGNANSNNNQSNSRYFPVRRVVSFDYTVPAAAISQQLGRRYDSLPGIANLGEIEVTIQGRIAILRGTVATEHDREAAARVALLEAGISAVQNELQVAEEPDSKQERSGPRAF